MTPALDFGSTKLEVHITKSCFSRLDFGTTKWKYREQSLILLQLFLMSLNKGRASYLQRMQVRNLLHNQQYAACYCLCSQTIRLGQIFEDFILCIQSVTITPNYIQDYILNLTFGDNNLTINCQMLLSVQH